MSAVLVAGLDGVAVELEEDYGRQAQAAAEAHLAACWEALNEDGSAVDDDPAVAPFCGCATCEVREILSAALPFLEAGFERERAGA